MLNLHTHIQWIIAAAAALAVVSTTALASGAIDRNPQAAPDGASLQITLVKPAVPN